MESDIVGRVLSERTQFVVDSCESVTCGLTQPEEISRGNSVGVGANPYRAKLRLIFAHLTPNLLDN